jgi:hypothetical protein
MQSFASKLKDTQVVMPSLHQSYELT